MNIQKSNIQKRTIKLGLPNIYKVLFFGFKYFYILQSKNIPMCVYIAVFFFFFLSLLMLNIFKYLPYLKLPVKLLVRALVTLEHQLLAPLSNLGFSYVFLVR